MDLKTTIAVIMENDDRFKDLITTIAGALSYSKKKNANLDVLINAIVIPFGQYHFENFVEVNFHKTTFDLIFDCEDVLLKMNVKIDKKDKTFKITQSIIKNGKLN